MLAWEHPYWHNHLAVIPNWNLGVRYWITFPYICRYSDISLNESLDINWIEKAPLIEYILTLPARVACVFHWVFWGISTPPPPRSYSVPGLHSETLQAAFSGSANTITKIFRWIFRSDYQRSTDVKCLRCLILKMLTFTRSSSRTSWVISHINAGGAVICQHCQLWVK